MNIELQMSLLIERVQTLESKMEKLEKENDELREYISKITESLSNKSPSTESPSTESSSTQSPSTKSPSKSTKHLSINIEKYKKSILVKNMYSDSTSNGTQNFKEEFKALGAKWFNNKELDIKGWLFVGALKTNDLEKDSKFIIDHFSEIELEFEFI